MSKNGLTREENRKAWLYAFLIVLGMGAVAALLVWSRSWNLTPVELRETNPLVTEAARGLDEITVDASFDPVARTLTVEQRMTLYNRTGETLPQAVVRSWTGAYLAGETSPCTTNELYWSCYPEGFDPGGPALESLAVNGQAVEAQWLDDAQTVLSLPVEGGWAPEASITLALDYRVDIPRCASRFGETEGIWALGNVFMLPALYEDGAWRTEAYLSVGDPFQSACANWTVRLTLPQGYTAAASGWGEALRVGAPAHPHRRHRHGQDGTCRRVASRAGLHCPGRRISIEASSPEHRRLSGLKAHQSRRHAHRPRRDGKVGLGGAVGLEAQHSLGAYRFPPLQPPQLGVLVQIRPVGALGKALPFHPICLYI